MNKVTVTTKWKIFVRYYSFRVTKKIFAPSDIDLNGINIYLENAKSKIIIKKLKGKIRKTVVVLTETLVN